MSKYKYKLKPQKWIPIGIIIFFILICCLVTNIISPNDKTMNIFLTSFGLGISAAVVYCSIIQNVIQKDNIKIQLFDKRYRVYQAVLDTITLIKRDNWDRYILYP